ncbi:MAG: hypothetical protein ACTHJ3_12025 [Pararhizobium sp.]
MHLQNLADEAALNGAHLGPQGDPSTYLDFVKVSAAKQYGPLKHLKVGGKWASGSDFSVSVSGDVPLTILAALPGFPNTVAVAVEATVRISEPQKVYKAPKVSELDPHADDYNRISVYCFNPAERNDPQTHGRTHMTEIADNAGNKYKYKMPECGADETLSYKLYNLRNGLADPGLRNSPSAETYEYYTDTVTENGVEHYNLSQPILETVLCDKFRDCKPESEGGIIPEGANRTPEQNDKACEKGKYMYYGWEDRPPNTGSDRDYNDIRIVIECPLTSRSANGR